MPRRFQFSLRRLLSATLLFALALGTFQIAASNTFGGEVAGFLLLIVCGVLAGASLGTLCSHPWVFGGIGAAVVLPALFVIKVFNC